MGAQIKKEVSGVACADERARARLRAGRALQPPPSHPPLSFQISIMKMVKHDNVVKLYEVLASKTKVREWSEELACARAHTCARQ